MNCLYCCKSVTCDFYLICGVCNKNIHINCLKTLGTPGDLLGDVFFKFTCSGCTENGKEIFVRKKLPWLIIIVLTIYNLSIQSQGLSNQGFFHWRTHIAHFIEKNWKILFPLSIKRKKKWIGTISGILSHHSPDFFCSGHNILRDQGWWKLTHNSTPMFYWNLYDENLLKKNPVNDIKIDTECESTCNKGHITDSCSRVLPYMGIRSVLQSKTLNLSEDINNVQIHLRDFLEENLSSSDSFLDECIQSKDHFENIDSHDSKVNIDSYFDDENNEDNDNFSTEINLGSNIVQRTSVDFGKNVAPRIIQVTNYQEKFSTIVENNVDINWTNYDDITKETDNKLYESKFTKTIKRRFPWHNDELDAGSNRKENRTKFQLISQYDENRIFDRTKNIFQLESECSIIVPDYVRRFYRKLCLRKFKKSHPYRLFNLESFGKNLLNNYHKYLCILDRFVQLTAHSKGINQTIFHSNLIKFSEYELFESPYTSRILHPFIYRSFDCFPSWIKILCQIQHLNNTNKILTRSSIDFSYIRPYHIAGVNGLLQRIFWPGIDMSDCLSYPDFSVVALYKKLIIGCAFLVPDVSYNEAYISFMAVRPGWNRVGIASFMLYHLTQTCMGKDITLHVSASNPAICLYQKFGFKIEEVILDFYEKFLPSKSKQSRHALFLRLKR